jgi:phospholipid/cholesterol/gamma-HCH transport system permease protein
MAGFIRTRAEGIGGAVVDTSRAAIDLWLVYVGTIAGIIRGRRGGRPRGEITRQMYAIGNKSFVFIAVTLGFIGMVMTYEACLQLQRVGIADYSQVGGQYIKLIVTDFGPTLTAMMLATRVGAGIAAEIGSMKVTEQIDALNTLGTDPIKKLVTPRVLAALVMLPILTIINDFVGIVGGNLISTLLVGIPSGLYWRTVWEQIASGGFVFRYIPNDFVQGLVKPFVFGGIISITACYFGLNTTGGTEGVGQATTRTVVLSSILILVVDYFLTQILLTVLAP